MKVPGQLTCSAAWCTTSSYRLRRLTALVREPSPEAEVSRLESGGRVSVLAPQVLDHAIELDEAILDLAQPCASPPDGPELTEAHATSLGLGARPAALVELHCDFGATPPLVDQREPVGFSAPRTRFRANDEAARPEFAVLQQIASPGSEWNGDQRTPLLACTLKSEG